MDDAPAAPRRPPPLPSRHPTGELVTRLERELSTLDSYEDGLHAGRLSLRAIASVLPCRASLVHLFDPYRKEFIVIDARGEHAGAMKLARQTIADPLLRIAMPGGQPFTWHDLSHAPVHRLGRFSALGSVRTVLVCPVTQGRYWYGAIELVDPLGGAGFRTEHETATRYVADRYAGVLCTRGVVTDAATVALFAYGV